LTSVEYIWEPKYKSHLFYFVMRGGVPYICFECIDRRRKDFVSIFAMFPSGKVYETPVADTVEDCKDESKWCFRLDPPDLVAAVITTYKGSVHVALIDLVRFDVRELIDPDEATLKEWVVSVLESDDIFVAPKDLDKEGLAKQVLSKLLAYIKGVAY